MATTIYTYLHNDDLNGSRIVSMDDSMCKLYSIICDNSDFMKDIELHNKKIPVPSAKVFSELFQRIPVVKDVIGDADSAIPSVIFQPMCHTRRTLQLNLGGCFE